MLEEIEQRNISKGSEGHRGSMNDMTPLLHQIYTLLTKGKILFI
jgi:hypothetical protein